jgi:hypothetical protein
MRTRREFLAACVLLLVIAVPIPAQVTGRVTGSVLDPSGSVIPGASVSLLMPGSTTALLSTATTSDGLFCIVGVRPDYYDLVVEVPGFSKHTTSGIKIDPAQELALPAITLNVEAANIKIEVIAGSQLIQTANAELSTTVTNEQVRKLPALMRSPLGLLSIQAGVSNGAGPVVINGQRASSVSVTLDGIDIRDNYIRTSFTYTPNLIALDQVAEMTVAASNSDSSLGGASSHVVLVTPSGTNSFHGSAYFYNSNSALAANAWFNNRDKIEKPSYNQNQMGGSFGGPIKKDKLYFYANYEAYRLPIQPTVNRTILTADARQGIFTYQDLQGKVQKVNILQAMGVSADPAMEKTLASVPGPDKINNYRVGDSSESLLRNTGGYTFLMDGHHTRDNVTAKLDYKISPANVLAASFLWNRQDVTRSDLSNDYSTVPKVRNDDAKKFISIAWRWNRGAGFTNELRGGFNLAPVTFTTTEQFGTAIIAGMVYSNPVNTFRGEGRDTNTYALMDNAVYVRGKHAVQFGFQMQQIRVRNFGDWGITPTYSLGIGLGNPGLSADKLPGIRAADLTSANALLATLAGYVTSYSQTFNVVSRTSGFVNNASSVRNYSLNSYNFYVEDSWKLKPNLTLNLGLRAEFPSVVDERDSLSLLPVVQNNDPIATLLSNSTIDFAGSAVGRPWYGRDKNNFAPNIGVAWDLAGDGNTVLRGGYSISYVNDETIRAISGNVEYNQGLSSTAAASGLTSRVSTNLPPVPTPVFKVPRTFQDNFTQNPYGAFGLPDPELRTPYIQQWSLGIQRRIKDTAVEIRYVGNHGVKLFRGYDVNPEVIVPNGFLDDFKRARQNGNLSRAAGGAFDPSYNPNIPGSQPLPVFAQLPYGGLLGNSVVRSLIDSGQTGELAFTYQNNRLNGPIAFYQNPFSLASILMANYSHTNYNALQIDVRRRTRSGIQYQANYTYGQVLSDSNGTAQDRWEAFRDPSNGQIDRSRPTFDITHSIKGNFIYPIPGEQQLTNRVVKALLGGWELSGIAGYQSGNPFSILSKRGTLLRAYRSGENTAATYLDKAGLDDILQLRMAGSGPYIVAASAIGSDGRGVAADGQPPFQGQAFSHPQPGEIGATQRRWFSGPWAFSLDLTLLKTIRIGESQSVELRVESFNIFNHPNWLVQDQDVSSTSFGRIADTLNSARKFQLSLHYRF